MTCTADDLLDNIRWRMESLTTHTVSDRTYKDFLYYDREKIDAGMQPGMTRGFYLTVSDGSAQEPVDGVMTEATQASLLNVLVRVAYYKHGDWHTLQKLMQADCFDLRKLLRNPTYWNGTAENASLSIGADSRIPTKWTFTEAAHAVYLDLTLQVYIQEDE